MGCDEVVGTNECVHRLFGCGGHKKHKTGRSKCCLYHGVGSDALSATKAAWIGASVSSIHDIKIVSFVVRQNGNGTWKNAYFCSGNQKYLY